MRVQTVGSVSEFLHREEEPFSAKVERHFKKYGIYYRVAGVTLIILASGSHAFATGSLDVEARKLYKEVINVGKWIIVFKGAVDILKAIGDGDTSTAKKTFISSLLTFLILLGLPYGMDKVTELFRRVTNGA